MKKILALMVGLMLLAVSSSYAAGSSAMSSSSSSSSSNGNWFVQAEGGIGIPMSSAAATELSLGWNGEAQVGYAFSKDFSLSVESGIESLSVNGPNYAASQGATGATFTSLPSLTHVPIELVGQYNISAGGSVTPYVLVGVGICLDTVSGTAAGSYNGQTFSQGVPTINNTNFELDPGVGVAFEVAKGFNLFVQGKLEMDFAPTTGTNGETTDNPIMIIPVQAGLTINFI